MKKNYQVDQLNKTFYSFKDLQDYDYFLADEEEIKVINNHKIKGFISYFENESKRQDDKIELAQRRFFIFMVLLVIIGIVNQLIRL